MPLKETMEILDYANAIVDQIENAYSDGVITTTEVIRGIIATMPQGVRALAGVNKVYDEIQKATEAEKEQIIRELLEVLFRLVTTFIPKKED
jgi:hypothetical protein